MALLLSSHLHTTHANVCTTCYIHYLNCLDHYFLRNLCEKSAVRKDDISPLGISWNSACNRRKAIRIENCFFCFHELLQFLLQPQMNICKLTVIITAVLMNW